MGFRPFYRKEHFYFITASITGWKCLFYKSQFIIIILNSLSFLRKTKKHYIFAFVIMPNHIHFINKPCNKITISEIMQSFFSYTSHEILKQLRVEKRTKLLEYFHNATLNFQARTPERASEDKYDININPQTKTHFKKSKHLINLNSPIRMLGRMDKHNIIKSYQNTVKHSAMHQNSSIYQPYSKAPQNSNAHELTTLHPRHPLDNKNSQLNTYHPNSHLDNNQVNTLSSDTRPSISTKNNMITHRSDTRPRVPTKIKHKIWQNTQAKNIYSLKVLEQKMNYIHSNPCNKKCNLSNNRADYIYSNACFYDKGIEPIIKIDNFRQYFNA